MRHTLLVFFSVLALSACFSARLVRDEFDKSLEAYNEMVRWQDFDRAQIFLVPSAAGEFRSRAEAATKAKMVDYTITGVSYDEKKGEASATVEFSYYHTASAMLKKVRDNQKWIYLKEGGNKGWRLNSPLPEFR